MATPVCGCILLSLMTAAKTRRREALAYIIWAVPPTLLWMALGGGARHYLLCYIPVFLLLAGSLCVCKDRGITAVLVVLTILVNYFAIPPRADTFRPSGRLFESALLYNNEADRRHSMARSVVDKSKHPHILLVGFSDVEPYVIHESMLTSRMRPRPASLNIGAVTVNGWQFGSLDCPRFVGRSSVAASASLACTANVVVFRLQDLIVQKVNCND